MAIRCSNDECRQIFGPLVGPLATISVGQQLYVLEGVIALTCEKCRTTMGDAPELAAEGTAQEVCCPACGKKSGELYKGGLACIKSAGRVAYAHRIVRVQCRCGVDWEPRYEYKPLFTPRRHVQPQPKVA